jgi:outer membrane murein-binding lipoprotein Lpp
MHSSRFSVIVIGAVAAALGLFLAGCNNRAAIERAETQVRRLAADLDRRTTETGAYIRVDVDDIKETDPWGTPLQVANAQGGVAEVVTVRSAGPDREFHTNDDIVAQGIAANLKGIGEGVKKHVGEAASEAAKGAVKGAVEGVKESIRDALPRRKNRQEGEPQPEPPPGASPDSQLPP